MTQYFGQNATVASGDGSQAAGDDLTNVETDIDIEVGDIWTGNEWNTDSFNDDYDYSDNWSINDSFQDNSVDADVDVDVENSNVGSPFGDANEFDVF